MRGTNMQAEITQIPMAKPMARAVRHDDRTSTTPDEEFARHVEGDSDAQATNEVQTGEQTVSEIKAKRDGTSDRAKPALDFFADATKPAENVPVEMDQVFLPAKTAVRTAESDLAEQFPAELTDNETEAFSMGRLEDTANSPGPEVAVTDQRLLRETTEPTAVTPTVTEGSAQPEIAVSPTIAPGEPKSAVAQDMPIAALQTTAVSRTEAAALAQGNRPSVPVPPQAAGAEVKPDESHHEVAEEQAPPLRAATIKAEGPEQKSQSADMPSGAKVTANTESAIGEQAARSGSDPLPDLPRTDFRTEFQAAHRSGIDLQRPAEFSRIVMPQILESAKQVSAGEIEISLHPAEIGRIRMTVSPHDAGVQIALTTDRPETMDLLRRHADILQQEFTDLGYTQVDINFGDRSASSEPVAFEGEATDATPVELVVAEHSVLLGADGRLDLRL